LTTGVGPFVSRRRKSQPPVKNNTRADVD
jgi:hypothetical protein